MPHIDPPGIAIAGLGTVGSGVAKILTSHQDGAGFPEIRSVLECEPKKEPARKWFERHPEWFKSDLEEILQDPEVDIIVETIGGVNFARDLTLEAFKRGKHVVTANKDLIACHGNVLCKQAEQGQRHYCFEAAVAGAIPVLRLLREYFQTEDLIQCEGILNGTTNYILSEMENRGFDFQETLVQAQNLGFAEKDPDNDILGYDARYKLIILTYLITGQWFAPSDFRLEGIDHLELPDFDYASRMGKSIKLIAHLSRHEEHPAGNDTSISPKGQKGGEFLQAYVLPMMIPNDAVLAKITGSTNVVSLKGRFSEDITLSGKGAGSLPTASAIVADLCWIAKNPSSQPCPIPANSLHLLPFDDYIFRHTLRFEVLDAPGIVANIGQNLAEKGINIYALEQLPQYHRLGEENRELVIFTITLEPCKEGLLQVALKEINQAPFMLKPVNVLRESI